MIGRYGGCFEGDTMGLMCDRAYRIMGFGCTGEVCTNSRVRIIHGLTISYKELTYLLQKSISHRNKALCACSQGGRLVGKDHRSSPTATHKEDNQRNTPCFKFVTQRLPYVHATGLANLNTSISQIHKYSTSMTLISPSLSQNNHQVSNFSQYHCTLYVSFHYIPLGCLSQQD